METNVEAIRRELAGIAAGLRRMMLFLDPITDRGLIEEGQQKISDLERLLEKLAAEPPELPPVTPEIPNDPGIDEMLRRWEESLRNPRRKKKKKEEGDKDDGNVDRG